MVRSTLPAQVKSTQSDEGKKSKTGSGGGRGGGGGGDGGRDAVSDDACVDRPVRSDDDDTDVTPTRTPITRSRNHTPTVRDTSQRARAATTDADVGGYHLNDGGGASEDQLDGSDAAPSKEVTSAGAGHTGVPVGVAGQRRQRRRSKLPRPTHIVTAAAASSTSAMAHEPLTGVCVCVCVYVCVCVCL